MNSYDICICFYFSEKVSVPSDKQFILIEGENRAKTIIESGDAGDVIESTTFTIAADNFAAWNITFVVNYTLYNSYI